MPMSRENATGNYFYGLEVKKTSAGQIKTLKNPSNLRNS
jgi:hypothetical protein